MAEQSEQNESTITTIEPQPGPQWHFLSTPADIAIYGGSAGSGKTFSLLMEPLRHIENPDFGAVCFRREYPQITQEGGMWDTSHSIYALGATPIEGNHQWRFPSGATITFSHMQHAKDRMKWLGSQIPLILWDQLEEFLASQFWLLVSRNRSTCGVRPYIRATCNPLPDSWLADLIDWWIADDGFPDPDRSGVIRWFVRPDEVIVWADTREELIEQYPELTPKSLTFIAAKIEDNQILLDKNPDYMGSLQALPYYERMMMLHGNWKVRPAAGMFFKREWIEFTDSIDEPMGRPIRVWDTAASNRNKEVKRKRDQGDKLDWLVGTKMAYTKSGRVAILDVVRKKVTPGGLEDTLKATADQDGRECRIVIARPPNDGGVYMIDHLVRRVLHQYTVEDIRETGSKQTRFGPFSAQAEHGNVVVLRGPWLDTWVAELEAFTGDIDAHAHDDQVDSVGNGYLYLSDNPRLRTFRPTRDKAVGQVARDRAKFKPKPKRHSPLADATPE